MQTSTHADRILDTALKLAESSSWESVNLHTIADKLDISLQQIKDCYPQKDDLVEAWFDRSDKAVLSEKLTADFAQLPAHERVHTLIMQWLLSMNEHRRVTREMLYYKLEFGHVHLQVLGLLRISRTVQWFREAAMLKAGNTHRIIEEVCLTRVFLTSFTRWLFDNSKDSVQTSNYLRSALRKIKSLN